MGLNDDMRVPFASKWLRPQVGMAVLLLTGLGGTPFHLQPSGAIAAAAICTGDCNGDDNVDSDEIRNGLTPQIFGTAPLLPCSDFGAGGSLRASDLVAAVHNAISACGGIGLTPTVSPTATATIGETPATATVTPTLIPSSTATPTSTLTPSPTETRTPTIMPSATPTMAVLCGDGITEGTETCDDGGTCSNGPDAGKRCPSNVAGGVDCAAPGLCRPAGGDGCAENCTIETIVEFPLGTSGPTQSHAVIQGGAFAADLVVLGRITARGGQPRDEVVYTTAGKTFAAGDIPVVETVADNNYLDDPNHGFPPIEVQPALGCACIRGFAAKSCGGTLDGQDCTPKCVDGSGMKQCAGGANALGPCQSDADCPGGSCGQVCDPGRNQCAEGYTCTPQDDVCTPEAACDFIHGPGNQASGVISCGSAVGPTGKGYDYLSTLDSTTGTRATTFSGGDGSLGSAVVYNSVSIASIEGSNCLLDPTQSANGPDHLPCTDDDPDKDVLRTIPLTTGTAEAHVDNVNQMSGASIAAGNRCGASECITMATGNPFVCDALTQVPPSTGGASLATAFGAQSVGSFGDVVVSAQFKAFGEVP